MSHSAVLVSGGPDSAVLLHNLYARGERPLPIHLNLGELESPADAPRAAAQAAAVGAELHTIDLSQGLRDIYRKPLPAVLRAPMMCRVTEPFGSGVALSIVASVAASMGARTLYYGVHKGDTMFRDNCAEFFATLSRAISIDLGEDFAVLTPMLGMEKSEVFARGVELGVDLAATWSCTEGSTTHCGECLACGIRRRAFAGAGLVDTTEYAGLGRETPVAIV